MVPVELLRSAIEQLPKATREIVRMWLGGASYQAIALQLHVPIGTLAARIFRAKVYLRSISNKVVVEDVAPEM